MFLPDRWIYSENGFYAHDLSKQEQKKSSSLLELYVIIFILYWFVYMYLFELVYRIDCNKPTASKIKITPAQIINFIKLPENL